VKTIEIANATASLSDYTRKTRRETLVVTRHGRPLAALLPLKKTDWESISLSSNSEFLKIVERSRASLRAAKAISTSRMRRHLAPKRKAK
jgi:prevent-host-death family protein